MTIKLVRVSVLILLALQGCTNLQPHAIKTGIEYKAIGLLRTYEVEKECKIAVAPGWKVGACAFYQDNPCRIVVRPDVSDETLGHELRHCFDGNWHSDDGV